jgi:hypothetical protein
METTHPALTEGEQQLVALVEAGLNKNYPGRLMMVRARQIRPDPDAWVELVIFELTDGRSPIELAHEPIARRRITPRGIRRLSESLLFSVRQQLDHQRRN